MQAQSAGKVAAGIVAWLLVGALALVATEYWDPLWGALPVLAAVVVMWLVGERVLRTFAAPSDARATDATKGAGDGA